MRDRNRDDVTIQETNFPFAPNFRGGPDRFNPKGGKRYFSIALTEEQAQELKAQGWNVKWPKPRLDPDYDPEQDSRTPHLKISIHYSERSQPRVVLITPRGRRGLPEDLIDVIDTIDIEFVDVTFRPYDHQMNGGGRTAYLKAIFVKMRVGELDAKWGHLPEDDDNPRALSAGFGDIDLSDVVEGDVLHEYSHREIGA